MVPSPKLSPLIPVIPEPSPNIVVAIKVPLTCKSTVGLVVLTPTDTAKNAATELAVIDAALDEPLKAVELSPLMVRFLTSNYT